MKVTSRLVSERVFNPYVITITVDTAHEHDYLHTIFSYYPTIPNMVTDNPLKHETMKEMLMYIYDTITDHEV